MPYLWGSSKECYSVMVSIPLEEKCKYTGKAYGAWLPKLQRSLEIYISGGCFEEESEGGGRQGGWSLKRQGKMAMRILWSGVLTCSRTSNNQLHLLAFTRRKVLSSTLRSQRKLVMR